MQSPCKISCHVSHLLSFLNLNLRKSLSGELLRAKKKNKEKSSKINFYARNRFLFSRQQKHLEKGNEKSRKYIIELFMSEIVRLRIELESQ